MLSKNFAKSFFNRASAMMGASTTRGIYTDETRPYVFINEHTKVICQGMTGKHVSFIRHTGNFFISSRAIYANL